MIHIGELWSKPIKIKELWYNAILQSPQPKKKSNIQFIMMCNLEGKGESYIVVSKEPLTLEDINKIDLDDYIFEGNNYFSKGVNYVCE